MTMNKESSALEKIEIIQSYIVTTARYDFNVYEKRVLYRIVEMMQSILQGKRLNQRYRLDKQLFELYNVEMPVSALLNNEEDTHYERTKNALRSMARKMFQFEDEKEWREIPLILLPKIRKYESIVKFKLHEDIYDALMNFSKGFKKFELKTAFQFESVYAMRFYELMSKQRTPLVYSIENLKIMFGVEKKYKLTADFVRWVIVPAQKELNEKSPYSFEYKAMKTGRKITSIKFYPLHIPANVDKEFETQQLKKRISPSWTIDRAYLNYLKEHYMFSSPEIRNNVDLFEQAQKEIPDLLLFLSELKAKANRAGNPKGYLINALRKKLGIKTAGGKTKK
jgi:plasmid replication initiation protein